MSLQHLANHVAQKGRHGDSTLVHVSKGELAGLQALAKNSGTTLTVNPHTGLPEAFNLRSLLPMAAGAALMATGVGAPMAAALVGGGTFAATGSLKQGLMAGLGAYGGAGLMGGVAGMGAAAGETAVAGETAAAADAATQKVAADQLAMQQATTGVGAPPALSPTVGADAATQSAIDYSTNAAGNTYELTGGYRPTFGTDVVGPPQSAVTPSGTQFSPSTQQALANPVQTGIKAAFNNPSAYIDKLGGGMQAAKYAGAAATPAMFDTPEYQPPEIKGDADMGQRYMYDSGYDASIPGRTANPSYTKVSNEEARKYYGFAEGGSTSSALGDASSGYGAYTAQDANTAAYGLGTGIDYSGYDTAPNQGIGALTPSVNPNQNIVDLYKVVDAKRIADEAAEKAKKDAAATYVDYGAGAGGGLMPRDLSYAGGGISTLGNYSDGGRLLKGPGDGMSDNIPAQIGAKQPARLADGEFVVPADVVSHLGNGSTDAGAKQLYKMMDKIRAARTGRKTQGKQINPNKFMPA